MTGARGRVLALSAAVTLAAAACSGGGGDDNAVPEPGAQAVPTTTAAPATTPPGDPETFEFISEKNPFTPLAGDQAGGGGAPAGGTGTATTSPGTAGTGGTAATGGATGGVEPEVAQRVALLDVFTEGGIVRANVRVNGTVYKVGVGDQFAGRYKVLSLSAADECGRFLFGDDAFRLCKGQQVTK